MRNLVGTVGRLAAGCAAVLAAAACAPAAGAPTGSVAGQPAETATSGHADCTKAGKAAIVQAGQAYAFSPASITLQRGGFLAFTNRSDRVQPLSAEPAARLVTTVLDRRERQVVQFPAAGAFTVRSAAGATLRVTVAGESGCGTPKPVLTIGAGNTFSPGTLAVAATINFTVVNKSPAAQALTCDPDPGSNGDHTRLESGETEILAIDKPGRYTCRSIQHPSAKVVITVS